MFKTLCKDRLTEELFGEEEEVEEEPKPKKQKVTRRKYENWEVELFFQMRARMPEPNMVQFLVKLKSWLPEVFDSLGTSTASRWVQDEEKWKAQFAIKEEKTNQQRGPKPVEEGADLYKKTNNKRVDESLLVQFACLLNSFTCAGTPFTVPYAHALCCGIFEAAGALWVPKQAWVSDFIKGMNLVRRKGTKAAKHSGELLEQIKTLHLQRFTWLVSTKNLHEDLVLNLDETSAMLLPVAKHTYATRGAKDVNILNQVQRTHFC